MVLENYDYRNTDGNIASSGELTERRKSTEDERAATEAAIGITDVTRNNPEFNYNPMLDDGRVITDPETGLPVADPGAFTNQEGYSIDPTTGLRNTKPTVRTFGNPKTSTPYDDYLINQSQQSAKGILKGLLEQFDLGGLSDWANEQIMQGLDANAVVMEMRYGTDPVVRAAYDTKFPGMALRREAGMPVISEATYIDTVRGYNQIAKAAGLNPDFLGTGTSLTQLIAGDISLSEWRSRIQVAEEAARIADPEVLNMLATRHNFAKEDIVAMFMDPEQTKSYMANKRVLGTAKISGTSAKLLGRELSFSQELSTYLNDMGVQQREVAQRLNPVKGLSEAEMTGTAIGESLFGLNSDNKVDRRNQGRQVSFKGRGGLMGTSQGMTGLSSANT